MTTRFKTSLAAALAVVTMATAAPMLMAQDQPQRRQVDRRLLADRLRVDRAGRACGRGGPMGFGPGFRELDLTDDQKAQLKTIAESHRDEFQAAGEKVAHRARRDAGAGRGRLDQRIRDSREERGDCGGGSRRA